MIIKIYTKNSMQNQENKKKQKKSQEQIWSEKLDSGDQDTVKEAIKEIREFGNIKILPVLIEKYSKNTDSFLRKELEKLLSDIKHKEAAGIMFQYVLNPGYSHIKKDLLTILWQSRLDFSPYVAELVEIFINEPFEMAFEAFTVLEYIENPIDRQVAKESIERLKQSLSTIDEKKKFLLVDLVNMLKKWA